MGCVLRGRSRAHWPRVLREQREDEEPREEVEGRGVPGRKAEELAEKRQEEPQDLEGFGGQLLQEDGAQEGQVEGVAAERGGRRAGEDAREEGDEGGGEEGDRGIDEVELRSDDELGRGDAGEAGGEAVGCEGAVEQLDVVEIERWLLVLGGVLR